MICEYGCGRESKFIMSNGKNCCEKNYSSCPAIREKNSKALKNKVQNNKTHKKYWLDKGYTEEEASSEIKKLKRSSIEYWLNKGYTEEQASLEIKKYNWLFIEYWLEKGYSEEEGFKKINLAKEKMANKLSNRSAEQKRLFNNLTIEYWLNKGYSEEESKQKIKDVQHEKFDYDLSIKKGLKTKKQDWDKLSILEKSNIMRARHSEQYERMKLKKHSPIFIEYWLEKGYSEEESKQKMQETKYSNNIGNPSVSKIETKFFDELEEFLNIKIIRNKYLTINKNIFCPDGRYNNILFEFNGTFIHLDERFYNIQSKNPFGKEFLEIKQKDDLKYNNYKESGYSIIIIWEYDYKNKKTELFNKLKEFLKDENQEDRIYWESSCL